LSFQDHWLLVSRPSLPEGGAIPHVPIFAASEAPEAKDSQDGDGDEGKDSLERTSSTMSPPPAFLKILELTRRGSVSKSLLPRVPLLIKLWPGKPSHQRTMESSSISWTRECPSPCFHIISFSCRLR
jgi:hypothetical protein